MLWYLGVGVGTVIEIETGSSGWTVGLQEVMIGGWNEVETKVTEKADETIDHIVRSDREVVQNLESGHQNLRNDMDEIQVRLFENKGSCMYTSYALGSGFC
jgi:hypothetical protein